MLYRASTLKDIYSYITKTISPGIHLHDDIVLLYLCWLVELGLKKGQVIIMGMIEANDGADLLMFNCCLSDSVGFLNTQTGNIANTATYLIV